MIEKRNKNKTGRRLLCAVLTAALMLGFCASCGGNKDGGTDKDGKKEEFTVKIIDGITPAEYYQNGYTVNPVIGIDQFERTFGASAGEKSDKERNVGIFYFLTLGQHGGDKIYDVSKILAMENGLDIMFKSDNEIAPAGKGYFWGEPMYGYYNSADTWVIRRHLALLTLAGVDFYAFDVTNAVTYDSVVMRIINEAKKMINEGWKVPGLVFYTNAYSHRVITNLYNSYYKKGSHSEVWYYVDGKPLIIGNISKAADQAEVRSREKDYKSTELPDEILNFFSFRDSQWPNDAYKPNGFPWIEWTYPAPVHNDVINVCVASHPALPMSFSLTRGAKNWGRGWNVETQQNEPEKAYEGQFFQSTWDVALKEDPGTVFVTGWNEWVAGKGYYDDEYDMVDLADMEFSRDAEMMKGGYNDAFYIQLAKNIRAYKNVALEEGSQFAENYVTVPMTDDVSVWDGVQAVFRDTIVVNKARNSDGAAPTVHYEQAEARNNVTEIRVASDADNFYFFLKATENITGREAGDEGWMNLFIGTGRLEKKGWEGYEFVIGRSEPGAGKLSVEKLNADFSAAQAGEAEFTVNGNVMQVKVPRTALGIKEGVNQFYFKFADGIDEPSDIMDYYVSGKSMPMGRLSYRYVG